MKILTLLFCFIALTSTSYGQNKEIQHFNNPVPKEIRERSWENKGQQFKLPVPHIREGLAEVDIYFNGPIADLSTLMLHYNNPITNEDISSEIILDSSGHAKGVVPIVSEAQVLLYGYGKSEWSLFLAPGKNLTIYIDAKNDKKFDVYFDGHFKEINDQYHRFDLYNYCIKIMSPADFYQMISSPGIDAKGVSDFVMGQLKRGLAELDVNPDLYQSTIELVKTNLRMNAANWLLTASMVFDIERKRNPMVGNPIFDKEYYSILRKLELNSYTNLYSSSTANSIGFAKALPDEILHRYFRLRYLNRQNIAELKRDNPLSDFELKYISFLNEQNPDNWDLETKAKLDTLAAKTAKWLREQKDLPIKGTMLLKDIESVSHKRNHQLLLTQLSLGEQKDLPIKGTMLLKDIESVPHKRNYQLLLTQLGSIGYTIMSSTSIKLPDFGIQLLPDSDLATNNPEAIRNFNDRFSEDMRSFYNDQDADDSDKTLSNLLGVDSGFIFDLTRSQFFSKKLIKQSTPLNKYDIAALEKIKNKSISSNLLKLNSDWLKKKITSINVSKVYHVAENITDPDAILAEIRSLFKDKAVLMDFWATWCMPCIAAIESLEEANIINNQEGLEYIYITDQSSPTKTWNNMMAKIGGQHIKLTMEQSTALKIKFSFTGIPAYLLIDKTGNVKYSHVGFEGPQKFKQLIDSLK